MRLARSLAAAAFTAALLAGSSAHALDPDDIRIGGHFAAGFAGDADLTIGSLDTSASLDPTLGLGARVDVPIHEYVAIGGLFELLFFEWDAAGAEREAVFDLDAYVRLRYAIELTPGSLWIEPYVALPFGLALAVLDDGSGGDDVWPGFNTGALAGAWLLLDIPISFYAEIGWRHHQVFTERRGPFGGDVDLKVVTNQFAMHFGAAFVLE